MRHALTLVATLLIGVAACAVDSATPPTDDPASSTSSTELSVSSSAGPITQAVTCNQVWECDLICGTWVNGVLQRYPTNVLHQECSDGSDTVLRTDACGEACF